ncbi:MAG: undecaprenyl-diphosphatase UppP [bacterium]|nr:undecaprenyl-diphosphatase UppP [bacterium]
MTLIQTVVLGIIEGLTEFLPISSTAHLILVSKLLHLRTSDFLKSFEISIQLGAIASIVFLYWKTLISKWNLNAKIITAFIPTAIIGLIFYKLVKSVLLENYQISVYALFFGGIALLIFEFFHKEKDDDIKELTEISYKQAVTIGLFQSISIIPGVSRAAATILGGMIMGIKRKTIVEFSFLLAIPTMIGATGLDLIKSADSFSRIDVLHLGVGFAVSFVMATISVKFLLRFVQGHNFNSFGIYRIIIAILFFISY